MAATEMITIPAARLAELEAIAAEVSTLKERIKKLNHNSIDRVKKYYAENPEEAAARAAERSKKYKAAHRETYNARRRELRRLKKEAAAAAAAPGEAPPGVDAPPTKTPGIE
jgi:hypothetical protein